MFLLLFFFNFATAQPSVVGGSPATAGEWPDAVAILDSSGTIFCSGTLISETLVLSAGHCTGRAETMVIDSHDLDQNTGVTRGITRTWQYADHLNTLDVAVFELDSPVLVTPRQLALACLADNYITTDATVDIVGYGATDVDGMDFPNALIHASAPLTDDTCSTPNMDCNEAVSPWGEMIAGGNGVDSCVGDSGGPLYLETPHGTFLAGITSRGVKPATTSCGDGGIYVRSEAAVDWVETETGQSLSRPDCESLGLNQRPRPADVTITLDQQVQTVQLLPNDPDSTQTHTYTIETAPVYGTISVDGDGWVQYTATENEPFSDTIVIRITDDGTPPLYGDATLRVSLSQPKFEDPGGFACTAVARPFGFYGLWLGIGGFLCHHRRRIRSKRD